VDIKQELHRLVEQLPESESQAAIRFLEYLCGEREDRLLQALKDAPVDDVPLSQDEIRESDAAWRDYLQGQDSGEPLEKVVRDLH
jgi:hypothetical protein